MPVEQQREENEIRHYYQALYHAWGAQNWWPADSAFEVIVGAYLTQNTAWVNVELALNNLRDAQLLTVEGIRGATVAELERFIRPAGYFRQKAARLKTFVKFLDTQHGGDLHRLFAQPTEKLREELLALNGVGAETADSILLYAGHHQTFVVDAYTRRIFERHGILAEKASYEEIRQLFQRALAPLAAGPKALFADPATQSATRSRGSAHEPSPMSTAPRTALAQTYSDMHGLIVGAGKNFCGKSQPRCDGCPLQLFLPSP